MSATTRAAAFVTYPLAAGALAAATHGWWPTPGEATVLLAATFGVSRCVANEKVGQPLRDALARTPLSELVTCPRCTGVWAALLLVALVALVPAAWPAVFAIALGGANMSWHVLHRAADRAFTTNPTPKESTTR